MIFIDGLDDLWLLFDREFLMIYYILSHEINFWLIWLNLMEFLKWEGFFYQINTPIFLLLFQFECLYRVKNDGQLFLISYDNVQISGSSY